MVAVSVSLFNGAVFCKSYSELLAACGTHRRDSRYIRTFTSPEDMVRKLMPAYATDDELIQALKDNIKSVRSGEYTIVHRPRPSFKTVHNGKSNEVLSIIKQALTEYCNNHEDDLDKMDEDVLNDIAILTDSEPKKLKSFVSYMRR